MEATRDVNTSVHDIARLVRADPALSGRLICAANAVRQGARRPVGSVPDAVTMLGISSVRQLAMGFSLVSNYRGGICRNFDYDAFWSRSLLAAIAVPAFAAHVRVAAAEELFVCGLLSRIGRLALATVCPAEYADLLEAQRNAPDPVPDLAGREASVFGISGVGLSAELLEEWGITHHLTDPLRHHEETRCSHFPEGSRGATLRQVMHLASFFADLCMMPEPARRRLLPQLFLFATQTGLNAENVIEISDRIVAEWRDWARLLEVNSHDIKAYSALATELPQASAAQGPAPDRMRLLLVDDDRRVTALLREALAAEYDVHVAHNGRDGIARALDLAPHIIIADWDMPDLEGTEVCRALRESASGGGIYMVVMAADPDDERVVAAFGAGVDDVVAKPCQPRTLMARLKAARRMWGLRREIERERGEIRRFASELVAANRRLQDHAQNDPVTGLPNRRSAMDRIQHEWKAAARGAYVLSCILVEVDRLQQINEALGFDAGDAALREIAARMRCECARGDILCRIGGSSFLVISPEGTADAVFSRAARLEACVRGTPFTHGGAPLQLSVSTGVATCSRETGSPAELIMVAERVLCEARESRSRNGNAAAAGGHSAAA